MLDVINSVILYSCNEDDNIANDEVSVANSQNISVKSGKCHLYKEKTRRKDIVNQTKLKFNNKKQIK